MRKVFLVIMTSLLSMTTYTQTFIRRADVLSFNVATNHGSSLNILDLDMSSFLNKKFFIDIETRLEIFTDRPDGSGLYQNKVSFGVGYAIRNSQNSIIGVVGQFSGTEIKNEAVNFNPKRSSNGIGGKFFINLTNSKKTSTNFSVAFKKGLDKDLDLTVFESYGSVCLKHVRFEGEYCRAVGVNGLGNDFNVSNIKIAALYQSRSPGFAFGPYVQALANSSTSTSRHIGLTLKLSFGSGRTEEY